MDACQYDAKRDVTGRQGARKIKQHQRECMQGRTAAFGTKQFRGVRTHGMLPSKKPPWKASARLSLERGDEAEKGRGLRIPCAHGPLSLSSSPQRA